MEADGVKKRLLEYIKYRKMTQSGFEKSIGCSNGYINNIRQSIQPDRLLSITQKYPDLNIAWLMVGEEGGTMLKASEKDYRQPEAHSLPLIPIEAFAGPGLPAYEDERVEDYYTVTEFRDSDFMLRVKGDSMSPKYCGGDLVACKKVELYETFFIQWGRVYVVFTRSQGCMIKRIQPSERDGWIKCVSDNPNYAPFDVPMEDVTAIALVNGSISVE